MLTCDWLDSEFSNEAPLELFCWTWSILQFRRILQNYPNKAHLHLRDICLALGRISEVELNELAIVHSGPCLERLPTTLDHWEDTRSVTSVALATSIGHILRWCHHDSMFRGLGVSSYPFIMIAGVWPSKFAGTHSIPRHYGSYQELARDAEVGTELREPLWEERVSVRVQLYALREVCACSRCVA